MESKHQRAERLSEWRRFEAETVTWMKGEGKKPQWHP